MKYKVNIGTKYCRYVNIIVTADSADKAGIIALEAFKKDWPIFNSCCFVCMVCPMAEYPFRPNKTGGAYDEILSYQ